MLRQEDWKENFETAFAALVSSMVMQQLRSPEEAFGAFVRQQEKINNTFWRDLARCLPGASAKQLHDFYHNNWSRQFCDDIGPFKEEVRGLIERNWSAPRLERNRLVFKQLQDAHPGRRFHYQSLYQFINYTATSMEGRAQKPQRREKAERKQEPQARREQSQSASEACSWSGDFFEENQPLSFCIFDLE